MNIETGSSNVGELTAFRKGSPFAPGTAKPAEVVDSAFQRWVPHQETIGEDVWRETAASASFSSLMLIAFAFLATFYFPAGGLAIGMLGLAMALLGLSSRYKRLSVGCLVGHGVLLGVSYAAVL